MSAEPWARPGRDRRVPSWPRAFAGGLGSAARNAIGRDTGDVDGSIRTVSVAFLANLVVAAAKWVGFALSGSSALLAESFHSTAVTINQALLLQGQLTSRKVATREHPFGFGQARYFWAFVVSVAIFGIGSVLSIGRGVLALTGGGGETIDPIVPLAALTVGLLMDGWSFLVGLRIARTEKGDSGYWRYIQDSKNPEVPVVILEDSAALVGLLFAYLGVGLTALTGNAVYDATASIAIGLLLATISLILARKMKSLLIGEAATPQEEERIRTVLSGHHQVCDVVYLRSLYIGPEALLVETKVVLRRDLALPAVAAAIEEMEREIRRRVPTARVVAIEPGADPGEDDDDLPDHQQSEPEG